MTTNHGYNTPDRGTQNWDVPLNANFEQLDRDVEIRRPESELGDYSPDEFAKFLATDTGAVYIGDGESWNALGSVSGGSGSAGSPDSAAASASSLADLQSKIDSVAANGGGTVFLAPGTYTADSKVVIRDGVMVRGYGPSATVVEAAGSDMDMFGDGDEVITNAGLADIKLDGNGNAGVAGVHFGYGLSDSQHHQRLLIENVHAVNCQIGGVGYQQANDSIIRNCFVKDCGKAAVNAAVNCNRVGVYDNVVVGSDPSSSFTHGISIEQSFNCTVSGNMYHGGDNPALAININTHENGSIVGNTVVNADPAIEAVRTCKYNTVVSNAIDGTSGDAINIRTLDGDVPEFNIFGWNTIRNPGGRAIYEQNGGYNYHVGNLIDGSGETVIEDYNPTAASSITDNEIRNSASGVAGIVQDQASGATLWNRIAGNVVEASGGIRVNEGQVVVTDNVLVDGDITGEEAGNKMIHSNVMAGGGSISVSGEGSSVVFNIMNGGSVSADVSGGTVGNNV